MTNNPYPHSRIYSDYNKRSYSPAGSASFALPSRANSSSFAPYTAASFASSTSASSYSPRTAASFATSTAASSYSPRAAASFSAASRKMPATASNSFYEPHGSSSYIQKRIQRQPSYGQHGYAGFNGTCYAKRSFLDKLSHKVT